MIPHAPRRTQPTPLSRLAVNLPIAVLLAFAILWRFGIVQTLRVSSANMVPTLALDDRVMIRSWGSGPEPGDVIVYRSPFDDDHLQLGRVVASGGDRVELGEEGLRLDGRTVSELLQDCPSFACVSEVEAAGEPGPSSCPEGEACACRAEDCLLGTEKIGDRSYFTRRVGGFTALHVPPTVVPDGHVFVLSDNRVDERDSRIYGSIPHHAIVGVLSFVYYARDESGIRWDRIRRGVS